MPSELSQSPDSATVRELESAPVQLDLGSKQLGLRRKFRHVCDKFAHVSIAAGGIGVIVAILLIFAYLLYEVVPLFRSAQLDAVAEYSLSLPESTETLHLAIEEQSEIAMRLGDDGSAYFFNIIDGDEVAQARLDLPENTTITSFALASESSGVFALGLDDGTVKVAAYSYQTSFSGSDNQRTLTPQIEYPFGEDVFRVTQGQAIQNLALGIRGDNLVLAAVDVQGSIEVLRVSRQTSLFAAFDFGSDASSFDVEQAAPQVVAPQVMQMFIDGDHRWVYFVSRSGLVQLLDLQAVFNGVATEFSIEAVLTEGGSRPTELALLLGGISLLVADDSGTISQWFLVRRDGEQVALERIREFNSYDHAVISLTPEQRRKNFVTADTAGNVAIYNTTAHREVVLQQLAENQPVSMAISPRGDALLIETAENRFAVWDVENEHPEVSWSALWSRVWYEGYPEPDYVWQSSAATNEFESKYSLVPLSFGTLKAAFYAMLLAAPLAICGAIFTGYFMAPAMRRKVKPLIELMEALPTVVLGFLAGLWLAPFVESNLLGVFTILVVMPLSILLTSFIWIQLPKRWRHKVPDGWEAGVLIPVVLLFGFVSFAVATPLESLMFDGDLRSWITNDLGITYDQRNAMVVGFAMGFAVIPTIFSIAEDAIFTVPKHLTYGSLALGATPWQSLYRVVLPTASPGIFSALMIGMGRAVGETMIVLMATGNTPVMDLNIFEGMRTLAANIAVEIPESEVDSTHYRILFLAALVLFMFTFVVNTLAEIVRQRLRGKYSTI